MPKASRTQTYWLNAAVEATDTDGYAHIPLLHARPLAARGLVDIHTDDGGWRITPTGRNAAYFGEIPRIRTVGGIVWTQFAENAWKVYAHCCDFRLVGIRERGERSPRTWALDQIPHLPKWRRTPTEHREFAGRLDDILPKAAPVVVDAARRDRDPLYCADEAPE